MLNYNEFVDKYLGKAWDYDGAYGAQCVDLIKYYLDEVWGIKPGSWGNAKYYWINFEKHPELVNNFTKIANTPDFVPQKGDIVIWDGNISSKSDCGHIAIANGVGNTHNFHSYDQNWGKKEMRDISHSYKHFYGVLRPKDQTKINPDSPKPHMDNECDCDAKWVYWKNGSTREKAYKDINCTSEVGSLDPEETAWCYLTWRGKYGLVYNVSGGYKAGFVEYPGKVEAHVDNWRSWKNGSTNEPVYADSMCKNKIGTIYPRGEAWCYDHFNGVYLVVYAIGQSNYKIGFVKYAG